MTYARACCTTCYRFRGPNQFNGLSDACIPCQKEQARWRREGNKRGTEEAFSKRRRENNEKYHAQIKSGRFRKYGLTEATHAKLVEDCASLCHICKRDNGTRELAIDHDHETGVVRGLLCGNCNAGLGMFKDNPTLLRKAIAYLAEPPAVRCLGEISAGSAGS